MTVKQAAADLGISTSTLYALIAAHKIPHERHGLGRGVIRLTPAHLAAYRASVQVEAREEGATKPRPRRRDDSDWRAEWEAVCSGQKARGRESHRSGAK